MIAGQTQPSDSTLQRRVALQRTTNSTEHNTFQPMMLSEPQTVINQVDDSEATLEDPSTEDPPTYDEAILNLISMLDVP